MTITQTKEQYLSPDSEVLEIYSEGEQMLVDSDEYYYEGAPDD